MNEDHWLRVDLRFEQAAKTLVFDIQAKRRVRIVELQGPKLYLTEFGITRPDAFTERRFGDELVPSDQSHPDVEAINRSDFRWACSRQLAAGERCKFELPASGPGRAKAVMVLVYEYRRLVWLTKKQAIHAALVPN